MSPPTEAELRAALNYYIGAIEDALYDYRAGRIESMVRTLRCGALESYDDAIIPDSVKDTIHRMHHT